MLREMREKKKITRKELAALSDIKVRNIEKWENGERSIDTTCLHNILKLCDALDCDIADLIESDDIKELYLKLYQ